MTWCGDCRVKDQEKKRSSSPAPIDHNNTVVARPQNIFNTRGCPSCGHEIKSQQKAGIQDLPGLPAGVKFDPSDQELLEHLNGKVQKETGKLHPLIDEFIPTLEGENGICYTHPEKLPGVGTDGVVRHFFHRPSRAYTTGTRKRRKVHTNADAGETRWHKTGKTRPVFIGGNVKGFKKILVLYTSYGKKKKPEKTNWVMHQYHLGNNEEEKDGELVVSKIFYQTQPRQCGSFTKEQTGNAKVNYKNDSHFEYYNPSFISFDQCRQNQNGADFAQQISQYTVSRGTSFIS